MPTNAPLPTSRQSGKSTPDRHARLRPASSEKEAVESLIEKEELITDPSEIHEIDDPEEWPGRYREGGFHPVQLGDQFSDGRYTIAHKLGHGSYSTVWLAHDETLHRKVAIKIAARRNQYTEYSNESGISRLLGDNPGRHPGAKVILGLLDSFNHQGPNGTHECFVTAPTGLSLARRKVNLTGYGCNRIDVVCAITAQLILGVAFLHSKGVVHGDLHTGNVTVALQDDGLAEMTVEEIYSKHGMPFRNAIGAYAKHGPHPREYHPPPTAPPYIVDNIYLRETLCHPFLRLSEGKIFISDFGESWQPALKNRYDLNTPGSCRAPEHMVAELLQTPISFPADVWALGCLIYELFSVEDIMGAYNCDCTWRKMIAILGKPPQAWCEAMEAREDREDEIQLNAPYTNRICPFEERVVGWTRRNRERLAELVGSDKVDVPTDEDLQDLHALLKLIFHWTNKRRFPLFAIMSVSMLFIAR